MKSFALRFPRSLPLLAGGLVLLALLLPAPAKAQTRSLLELEPKVNSSVQVEAAMAGLTAAMESADRERHASGLKLFGGSGYSWNNEPTSPTSTIIRRYQQGNVRGGVSLPLLGSWSKERMAVLGADAKVLVERARVSQLKTENLSKLRKAYAAATLASAKIELCRHFLSLEPQVDAVLSKRRQEGVILESERQDLLGSFAFARREMSSAQMILDKSLAVIQAATDEPLTAVEPMSMALPEMPASEEAVQQWIANSHPEVALLKQVAELRTKMKNRAIFSDIEANVEATVGGTKDYPGLVGDTSQVAVNVRVPLELPWSNAAARASAQAEVRKAELDIRSRVQELTSDYRQSKAFLAYAAENLSFSDTRLRTAITALRESSLRQDNIAVGDTLSKAQQSRAAYLAAALDSLEAQSQYVQGQADLLRFAEADRPGRLAGLEALPQSKSRQGLLDYQRLIGWQAPGQRASAPKPVGMAQNAAQAAPTSAASQAPAVQAAQPVPVRTPQPVTALADPQATAPAAQPQPQPQAATPASPDRTPVSLEALQKTPLTFYAWDAAPWLDDPAGRLDAFTAFGGTRLLLSFTPEQIAAWSGEAGLARLSALEEAARQRGVRLEWLLGDPSWIDPERRPSLLKLLRRAKDLGFAGVHLDIEQDQLSGDREALAAQFLDTVAEAKAAVGPLPLGISIHPRYLEPGAPDYGSRLAGLNIAEVAVMIYATPASKAAARFAALVRAHRKLRLSLAVSVEKSLAPNQSFFALGRAGFLSLLPELSEKSQAGVVVQSLEDFVQAKP